MFTLAQDTIVDPDTLRLGSITAVVVVTMLVMQFAKPWIGTTKYLKCVPVICYTVVLAIVLTVFANRFLKSLPGDNLYQLVWRAMISVLGSAGLFHLKDATTPVGNTVEQPPTYSTLKLALLVPLLLPIVGCTASPTSRLAAADQAYTLTLSTLSDLRATGYLNDDAARRVEVARLAAAATLNEIQFRIGNGTAVEPAMWDALANAVAALIQERLVAEQAKHAGPTTHGVGTTGPSTGSGGTDQSGVLRGTRADAGRTPGDRRQAEGRRGAVGLAVTAAGLTPAC